jgi:hypothetical protein
VVLSVSEGFNRASIDDTLGVPTRGEPSILIPNPRKVVKGEPDLYVVGCDIGELYTEGLAVLIGSLKIVTASERVELPDEFPTVLGSLQSTSESAVRFGLQLWEDHIPST